MKWELIEKMVSDLSQINYKRRISWIGINEPMLDKRLPDIIRYVKGALPDVFQSTITNGDALNQERYRSLKSAGIDSLAISVYDDEAWVKAQDLATTFPEIRVWDQRRYFDFDWAIRESKDFTNRAGGVAVSLPLPDMRNTRCLKPFTGMSVLPNGNIPLCSDDMYGDVIMGNAYNQRLDEIWFSDGFERYRARLLHGRRGLPLCDGCTNKGGPHAVRFP